MIWEYGYDLADQLTRAVKRATDPPGTILQRFAYAYDPAGNRTAEQIDDQVLGASYDGLNRLVSQQPAGPMVFSGTVSEPAAVTVQGVPAVVEGDNTFRATVPLPSGTNTVSVKATDASGNTATNQYEVDSLGSGRTFTYDANGNLTADGTRAFEWDARNQLVAVNVGTHRSEFTYDGEQQRVRLVEKEGGVTQSDTKVVWCRSEICEERSADGVTVTRRAFTHGEQLAGIPRYFVTDHLGSVTEVADAASVLLGRYAFDPWGRRILVIGSDVTTVGYTGHRMHEASALVLTMFRGYDVASARWLSEDQAGATDGLNLYRYVSNSPINRLDRLGLAGQKCWDKLTVTSVLSCSAELVGTSGVCWGAKGKVNKLCNELKDEIAKKKEAVLPSVACPAGETCQDKKPFNGTFPAVNETLTLKVGPCTATIRLNGQFIVRGEMGTCRGCQ